MSSLAPQGRPTVTLIIVTWNSAEHLKACLESIRPLMTEGWLSAFVVDNASADGSVLIAQTVPGVTVIANSENVGFARANNQVLRDLSSDYALLLNPDTLMPPEAVRELVAYATSQPKIGALGPRLVDPAGRFRVKNGGWALTPRRAILHFLGVSGMAPGAGWARGFQRMEDPSGAEAQDWLSGACLLLRREALVQSGLFDERWFLYVEDVDLCDRIQAAGWQVVYHPGVTVTHLVGGGRRGAVPAASPSPRPGSWIGALRAYLVWRNRPSTLTLALCDAAIAIGLGGRGLAFLLRSLRPRGAAWRGEAHTFFRYLREHLGHCARGKPDPSLRDPRVPAIAL